MIKETDMKKKGGVLLQVTLWELIFLAVHGCWNFSSVVTSWKLLQHWAPIQKQKQKNWRKKENVWCSVNSDGKATWDPFSPAWWMLLLWEHWRDSLAEEQTHH